MTGLSIGPTGVVQGRRDGRAARQAAGPRRFGRGGVPAGRLAHRRPLQRHQVGAGRRAAGCLGGGAGRVGPLRRRRRRRRQRRRRQQRRQEEEDAGSRAAARLQTLLDVRVGRGRDGRRAQLRAAHLPPETCAFTVSIASAQLRAVVPTILCRNQYLVRSEPAR